MKLRPLPRNYQPRLRKGQMGFIMNPYRYSSGTSVTTGDAWRDQTVLELLGIGTNGQTTTVDSSPSAHAITLTNATISTAQSKWNGSSYYFNGTSARAQCGASSQFRLRGDFSFEVDVRCDSTSAGYHCIAAWNGAAPMYLYRNGSDYILYGLGGGARITRTGAVSTGTWQRLSIDRTNGVFYLRLDGDAGGLSYTSSYDVYSDVNSQGLTIGCAYSGGSPLEYFDGYISHARLTHSCRFPGNHPNPTEQFNYTTTLDGYWNDVIMHLSADETNGVAALTDRSIDGRAWTFHGGAGIANTVSRYGSTCLALPSASSSYIQTPASGFFPNGTYNFTIEADVYFNSVPGTTMYIGTQCNNVGTNSTISAALTKTAANKIEGFACSGAAVIGQCTGTTTVTTGTWYHVCYMRIGSNFYLFINGTLEATASSASSINVSANAWAWGRAGEFNGLYLDGYLANMRITLAGRYNTTWFKQPSAKHPILEGNLYPWHDICILEMNGADNGTTFTDSSKAARTVTVNGNPITDADQKVFGSASGYYNNPAFSAANYLSMPHAANARFGANDFHVQCKIRFSSIDPATYYTPVFYAKRGAATNLECAFYYLAGNLGCFISTNGTTTAASASVAWGATTGVDYDVEFIRISGTIYIYVDGALLYSGALAGTIFAGTANMTVFADGTNAMKGVGWIDSMKVRNGATCRAAPHLKRRLAHATAGW